MLLDLNKYIEKEELKQITTSNLMIQDKYDSNGLFSNIIFGLFGSSKWRTKHAFIDLKCNVLHPLLYEIADRRCSALLKFFRGELSILNQKLISGNSGEWGVNYFESNLENVVKLFLDQGQLTDAGKALLRYIVKHKKTAFVDKCIVLPPQFRPMYIVNNKMDLHPLNDKYLSILNEVDIIAITAEDSRSYKEILSKIQLRLFEAFQILKDMLKGKAGVQRKSLLGKSMDFSARAVIVGDPTIPPNKVGVPFKITLSIFKPFVIHKSITKYATKWEAMDIKPSILSIGNLITTVHESNIDLVDPSIISLFLEILKELCDEKVVIMKRDPSLHRTNLQAFYPTVIFTDSFHINPLVTDGFGADFDGDQMAIYLPLTEAAQQEAKEKMIVSKNIWGPTGTDLTISFKNDAVAGVYFLTADPTSDKVINMQATTLTELTALMLKHSDPTLYVTYNGSKKTIGRAIVENITGVVITKQYAKKDISKLFVELAKKEPADVVMSKMHDLMQVAMITPTLVGKSINIDQFKFPEKLQAKKEEAFKSENPSIALKKLSLEVAETLKEADSLIYDLYNSGSRGNLTNIQTQIVAKGYVEDTDGSVSDKPIKASLSDGLTTSEFVDAGVGGRKGIVDRSQMTAISGYLTRQMVYCNASVKASTRVKDCGSKKYFEIKTDNPDVAKSFIGRYTSNGQLIESVDDILNKSVKIKTPLYCTSPEICQRCLGDDVTKRTKTTNIGILSAQLLGERGSQLTMRTFHTGGAGSVINFLEEDSSLSELFAQDGNDIITKQKLKIIFKEEHIRGIDINEYLVQNFTVITDTQSIELFLTYDFTVVAPTRDSVLVDGKIYSIEFDENVICGSMKNSSGGIVSAIADISKLLNSRLLVNETLVMKLHELYSAQTFIPMWALEVLCSQLARNPDNLRLPYRLSNMRKDPIRIPIKQVALVESWKRGAAFENVSNALHSAVLNNADDTLIASDLDNLLDL